MLVLSAPSTEQTDICLVHSRDLSSAEAGFVARGLRGSGKLSELRAWIEIHP